MIIARQHQHPAIARGARRVAVFQRVAGAVDAGALGIKHGKDTIDSGVGKEVGLLAAPDRRCGQVFVEARREVDGMLFGKLARLPKCGIEAPQGGAPVTRHKAGGVESGCLITRVLQHGQAHQSMGARQQHTAFLAGIAIVKGDADVAHVISVRKALCRT